MTARLVLALLVCAPAVWAPLAHAQTAPDLVGAVREAVERLDYDTAEVRAREALARYEALSPDDLVEVHAALGTLLAARGAAVEAREQFGAALSLDPNLALDPVLVPPATISLFESVRADAARAPAVAPGVAPAVRYVVLPDPRAGAALRSAALPGWGQAYRGDRGRAVAFGGAAAVTAGGAVAAHVAYRRARAQYLAATLPDEIDAAYGRLNGRYRLRTALAVGAGVVWAASVAEALVTGRPRVPRGLGPGGLSLRVGL